MIELDQMHSVPQLIYIEGNASSKPGSRYDYYLRWLLHALKGRMLKIFRFLHKCLTSEIVLK